MRPRARARLALIRVTEEALQRYPDRTVAVVRARLERSLRTAEQSRFDSRVLLTRLSIRAMDVHPSVAERLVRWWLRRAAQQQGRTQPAPEQERLRRP